MIIKITLPTLVNAVLDRHVNFKRLTNKKASAPRATNDPYKFHMSTIFLLSLQARALRKKRSISKLRIINGNNRSAAEEVVIILEFALNQYKMVAIFSNSCGVIYVLLQVSI